MLRIKWLVLLLAAGIGLFGLYQGISSLMAPPRFNVLLITLDPTFRAWWKSCLGTVSNNADECFLLHCFLSVATRTFSFLNIDSSELRSF